MSAIGIFYGSTTGNTRRVARMLQEELGDRAELIDVAEASTDDLLRFDKLLLGSSTWGAGELQKDWQSFLPLLRKTDLKGKDVALFALGDQSTFTDTFANALAPLKEAAEAAGAAVTGNWPAVTYDFADSRALKGKEFIGLAVDEDNQADHTRHRIQEWLRQLNW